MKPNINDLSNLQDLKRVLTEKDVTPVAIKTIERALNKGMVFKRPEDLAILNIPTLDLTTVGEVVTFGSTTVVVKNIKTVEYSFKPIGDENFFFGYQLLVLFVNADGFSVEQSYPIEDTRRVIVDLDLNDLLDRSKVTLRVNSAQGSHARIALTAANVAPTDEIIEIPISALANAEIDVEVTAVAQLPNPPIKASYQIKGKLISSGNDTKLDGYQVVIFGATANLTDGTPDFLPVAFATTETNGYFITSFLFFNVPDDIHKVIAGKVRVTKDDFSKEVPIRLVEKTEGEGENIVRKSMLPDRLIVVISEESEAEEPCKNCGCTDLNFHEKKVLEEYSYYTVVRTTEPSIIADVLEDEKEINLEDIYGVNITVPFSVFLKFHEIESKQIKPANFGVANLNAIGGAVLAKTVNTAATPVEANPAPATGVNPAVKATFNRDLLDKLVVEHKVKTVIKGNAKAVFKGRTHLNQLNQIDWDDEPTIYQAASIAHGHLLHFKQEWIPDGYSIGDIVYSLPLAPGQKKQIAVLDWERRESAANSQTLDYEETLNNSLVRDRDINEVISATLTENVRGNSKATTGGIGFGLGGAIMGVFSGGSFGALLGVSGGKSSSGSNASQSSNRESTANSLQSISDRTTQAASFVRSQRSTVVQTVSQGERVQATAESVANYNHCHAITIQYFEVLRHFAVRNRLAGVQECLFVPLQMTPFDLDKCLRWRNTLERHVLRRDLRAAFKAVARIANEKESPFENYYDSIGFPRKNFAEQNINFYSGELFMEFFFFNTKEEKISDEIIFFYNFFGISLDGFRDKKITDEELAQHVGPRAIEYLLDAFTIETDKGVDLKLDLTLLNTFRQNARLHISVRQSGTTPVTVPRDQINAVNIKLDLTKLPAEQATNLVQFQNKFMKIRVRTGNLRYRTDNFADSLFNGRLDNDIFAGGDGVFIPTPLNRDELRNPRGEDVDAANNLLHHLNENLEYYHKCLFFDMTPERRFMLLDGIVAPGKANGRSVASVVENRVIGIAGNSLIMPVAPGNQLDPTIDETFNMFAQYFDDEKEPMRISMPTKGIYAESVMGKCNSCEEKDESRFWRWEESPIPDSPNTQILPLNTDSRRADPGNLQPKDFAPPVVNIQNAPNLPDPTGLQGILQLIGKGDAFRDLTGLNQNQLNALATFQKTLDTAESFGKEASSLAKAAAANKLIEDAQKSGAVSNEKAKELTEKNINAAIPQSAQEQLTSAKDRVNAVQDALQTGGLTPEQAQELTGKILSDGFGLSNDSISRTDVNDLAANFDKGSLSSIALKKPGESVEVRAFEQGGAAAPPNNLLVNLTPGARVFHLAQNDISGVTTVRVADPVPGNTYSWDWDRTNYQIDDVGFFIVPVDPPTNSQIRLHSFRPGIHYLSVQELDGTGAVTRRKGETLIGTPQFVTVTEDATLFDAVLTQFDLMSAKGRITQSAHDTCNQLLKKVNVRILWDVGPVFNQQLSVIPQPDETIYDTYLGGTPLSFNINPIYTSRYVTKVNIEGAPPASNPLLGGVTTGAGSVVGVYSFNEQIRIFPGSFDTRAQVLPNDTRKLVVQLAQIFAAVDAQRAVFNANPTDQAVRMEFLRLQQLQIEVLGRIMGRTIAHEIVHALLGSVSDLDIGGHATSGLLATFPPSLQDAIGIEISDEANFPKANTYKFLAFPFTDMRPAAAKAMTLEPFLQTKLNLLYPVPPIKPFDK